MGNGPDYYRLYFVKNFIKYLLINKPWFNISVKQTNY